MPFILVVWVQLEAIDSSSVYPMVADVEGDPWSGFAG